MERGESGKIDPNEDVYSPHRQKTQKNTIKNRLQYDETIQYNILQYSRVKKIQIHLLHKSNKSY